MKEATGELNMTLVTIIAIAAVLLFVSLFLPNMLQTVGDRWNNSNKGDIQIGGSTGGSSGGSGETGQPS